jgi:hypothetical protein
MPRPQRDLELEAAVGIAQLVAEQILHLTQPVPDGLRVHVHMLRHLVGVTAGLEPGQQRLGQPILLGGAKALQRAEPGRKAPASSSSEKTGQLLVGEEKQGGQVLVAAHQVLAAVDDAPGGEAERQPRPAQRRGGPGQRHHRWRSCSSPVVPSRRAAQRTWPDPTWPSCARMRGRLHLGAPGPGFTDITVQNQCPLDQSDHLELAYDPVAMAEMLNALDPSNPVSVPCVPVLPVTGPVGPVPPF